MNGKTNELLANVEEQYKNGANPLTILQDLVNIAHMLAKAKIIPSSVNDISLSESEKDLCKRLAPEISIAVLSKVWQMLIKGISELAIAPVQIDAVEMILIRIAYSANLPTPYELLNDVKKNSSLGVSTPVAAVSHIAPALEKKNNLSAPLETTERPKTNSEGFIFTKPEELIDYLENHKKILAACALKKDVSIMEFRDGYIKMVADAKINTDFVMNLHKTLLEATGKEWKIDSTHGTLGETIASKEKAAEEEYKRNVSEYPLVKAILAEFKGAKIETLTRKINNSNDVSESDTETNDNEIFFDEE